MKRDLLLATYGLFSIAATARATFQIATDLNSAPVPYLLSLAAATTYVAMFVALYKLASQRTIKLIATIELLGVTAVGTASIVEPNWFASDAVWSIYGQGYGFIPLILPLAALSLSRRSANRSYT